MIMTFSAGAFFQDLFGANLRVLTHGGVAGGGRIKVKKNFAFLWQWGEEGAAC